MSIKMSSDKAEFLAELNGSRVRLCKRAATSLSCAWSEVSGQKTEIDELKAYIELLRGAIHELNSCAVKITSDQSVVNTDHFVDLLAATNKTPPQCLADFEQYANQLREDIKS